MKQGSHRDVHDRGVSLRDAKGAVEVTNLQERLLGVSAMQCECEGEEQHARGDPEHTLRPAVAPGGDDGEHGCCEEGKCEVVVGGEDEREGDSDEEGSGGSA